MANIRDLGFSPFIEGYTERGEEIASHLSPEQIEALTELETYRRQYFADLREFFKRKSAAVLRTAEDTKDDPTTALAVGAADLALRMSDKFALQMAEIIAFGKRQGPLPELESTRIL